MKKITYMVLTLTLITGCAITQKSERRIDSTTNKTYETSYIKLLASLSEKEKIEFHMAMLRIKFTGIGSVDEIPNLNKFVSATSKATKSKIHNLTYYEIVTLSKSIPAPTVELAGNAPGLPLKFKESLKLSKSTPLINLKGTTWEFITNINGYIKKKNYTFRENGLLEYERKTFNKFKDQRKSNWQQEGNQIRLSINNDYSIYLGIIESTIKMKGESSNIHGLHWTWTATLLE